MFKRPGEPGTIVLCWIMIERPGEPAVWRTVKSVFVVFSYDYVARRSNGLESP